MKTLTITLVATMMLTTSLASQGQRTAGAMAAQGSSGSIPLGIGGTIIDGQTYYLVNLAPELAFGNLGFGLDLNLRVGPDGKVRKEDYDEGYDYIRMIRYVRWAQKGDPFYIRLGQLNYSRLGHGSIVYLYNNSPSYDLRKVGVELDVNFEKFGAELLYSDFGGAGLFGMRGYVKPLKFTTLAKIPVINNFEVGATIAADVHADANKRYLGPGSVADDGSMSVMGLDLGLPIIDYPIFKSALYFDFASISGYGSGAMAGITFDFSGLGLITLSGKYERQFLGDQFLPAYFDALYERERFAPIDSVRFMSKAMRLSATTASEGYYGELILSILGTINVIGGYQSPVGVRNAGTLHLELQTGDVIPVFLVSAGYDKRNVGSVFKLDNNSLLYAEVGYKPYPFMIVSTVYQWTFKEKKVGDTVVGYETQKRIEPKVSFVFSF